MKIVDLAEICYELNRAYCTAIADTTPRAPWAEAPKELQDSVIEGIKTHLAAPDLTPEQSHEAWMKYKLEQGWKQGSPIDYEKKEHPNLVPWDQLRGEECVKDHIFKATVAAMAKHLEPEPAPAPAPAPEPAPVGVPPAADPALAVAVEPVPTAAPAPLEPVQGAGGEMAGAGASGTFETPAADPAPQQEAPPAA